MTLGVPALSWAQWLARALDLPFTSYAVNGATASDALHDQLPRVRATYDLATLYIGVNDVRDPEFDALAYGRDLDAVAGGLAAHADRLLMLTMPHDLGRPRSAPKPVAANAIIRASAQRHGALVADLADFAGRALVIADAVHPTPLGQLEIADRAARALGATVAPSSLVPGRREPDARYAAAYARAAAIQLVRRGRERARRMRSEGS